MTSDSHSTKRRKKTHSSEAPEAPQTVTSPAHIKDLVPDPRNARRHNPRNIGMIEDALHEVGAARSIVIDEGGRILVGNGTVEAAAQAGIERVKVVEADGNEIVAVRRRGLTERQKLRLSLLDNRSAEVSGWESGVLRSLQQEDESLLNGVFTDNELRKLLERAGEVPIIRDEPDVPVDEDSIGGERSVLALKNVNNFPSSNPLGFPDLMPDRIYSPPDSLVTHCRNDMESVERLVVYKSDSVKGVNLGKCILCYYTFDENFEQQVQFPAEHGEWLLVQKWAAVVTPNLSLLPGMSRVEQMWRTFVSRRFGRYCQEIGIPIIPDIEWMDDASFDFVLLGIPQRPAAIALQMHTRLFTQDAAKSCERGLEIMAERLQPQAVLLYGPDPYFMRRSAEIFSESRVIVCYSFNARVRQFLRARREAKKQGEKHA